MRFILPRLMLAVVATIASGVPAASFAQQALAALAKQNNCIAAPLVVDGTDLYKCQSQNGMSYFSGPSSGATSSVTKKGNGVATAPKSTSPTNFPRVDPATQRDRDDVRKRVLTEELATEVRMMVESEVAMKVGGAPLPDESLTSPKYLDRMAKLRTTVENHNKNIQALNKELERLR